MDFSTSFRYKSCLLRWALPDLTSFKNFGEWSDILTTTWDRNALDSMRIDRYVIKRFMSSKSWYSSRGAPGANRTESVRHVVSNLIEQNINMKFFYRLVRHGRHGKNTQGMLYGIGPWNLLYDNGRPHTEICVWNVLSKRWVTVSLRNHHSL